MGHKEPQQLGSETSWHLVGVNFNKRNRWERQTAGGGKEKKTSATKKGAYRRNCEKSTKERNGRGRARICEQKRDEVSSDHRNTTRGQDKVAGHRLG